MENMTLMLVLLLIEGLAVGQSTVGQSTERGFVGNNVLLPCICPGKPDNLVWQIDERVVSVYSQSKDDINTIDKTFVNRTQLFLHMDKKNCSMLLLKVSLVDAGVYTCHALKNVLVETMSRSSLKVNLTVSENTISKNSQKGKDDKTLSSVHIGIPILLLIIILAAGLLLIWLFRRKRQNHQNIIYVPAEPMKNTV